MTNQPAVNPVDVARIALKRLAERGLAPTPDNYAQFYNAILTIKAPEAKSSNEIQMAWEVLYSVNDILDATDGITEKLMGALEVGSSSMAMSLGALRNTQRAHREMRASSEETHTALEDLLNQVISNTHNVHSSVVASHEDLQAIRNSIQSIENDLAVNRKLLEQDPLTGALNRQGFEHLLTREVKRAHRQDGKLTAIILDLDDFKQVNDRFGHLVGDQVLVHVANLAKAVLRDTDILVRYGGEEFLVLLPETDLPGAKYVVDRLRLVAGNTPFIHKNQRIDVRFSVGVAALKAEENGRALILRADEALYRAKHSGRGRVEIAE